MTINISMDKLYSKDFTGEFIVYNTTLANGKTEEEREWIPKTVNNDNHTGHAIIIGNGVSRKWLQMAAVLKHKGGHLGKKKLQTYGCNALYREVSPDFLVATDSRIVDEIYASGYADTHIVYTSSSNILKYPGKFHLIPNSVYMNSGAMATYLACFDGHKRVYLSGFDNQNQPGHNNNIYAGTANYDPENKQVSAAKWIRFMAEIFRAYDDVDFVRLNPYGETPAAWKGCLNYREITYRQFVYEADLG
jgi:hypothetical protein